MSPAEIASNVANMKFRAFDFEHKQRILDGIHPILLKRASAFVQEKLENPELRKGEDVQDIMEWKTVIKDNIRRRSEFRI